MAELPVKPAATNLVVAMARSAPIAARMTVREECAMSAPGRERL
jgi:hypothetical protein